MKKLLLATFAFSLWATVSRAQDLVTASQTQDFPRLEVSQGYSFLEVIRGGNDNFGMNGWNGSAVFNINKWFGVVGDFGFFHGTNDGGGVDLGTYMFGPRISYRKKNRVVPFGEALIGGSHATGALGDLSPEAYPFAYGFGGGVDIELGKGRRVALRPQVDYLAFSAGGITGHTVRTSLGLVFHFGGR